MLVALVLVVCVVDVVAVVDGDVVGDVTSHVENKPSIARIPSVSK